MSSFRGASSDAFAALETTLRGVGQDDLAATGDELFGVARLLRDEPSLRRVVTDAAAPAEAKQQLVRSILGTQVSATSLTLVSDGVARRWTRTRDLADALERLAELAVARSAGSDVGTVSDQLFALGELVRATPDLRDALSDPSRSAADKAALIGDLLASRAHPATVTLARQSVSSSYRTVGVALETYQQVAASVNDERVATVTVAQPLSDADRARLIDVLSRQYARPIHLNVLVDETVIGGVRVEIGDDVIDGTLAGRLDTARRQLAG